MTEARFERLEALGQVKRLVLATGTQGLKYLVQFELGWDRATPMARLFKAKVPLLAEWLPEGGEEVYSLGIVRALRPSSLSTDADGEVRFVVTLELPEDALAGSVGALAGGLYGSPVEGPAGRLSLEAQQAAIGL